MRDSQLTELSGRHFLVAQLVAGGLEVALPVRDRGVDDRLPRPPGARKRSSSSLAQYR